MRVICADALEALREMADGSVHCCVTSPPYWGLRDYGVDAQLGLEDTPELYVAALVEVFREVRRVLRDDGTVWLVLGDSYATGGGKVGRCPGGGDQGERFLRQGHTSTQPNRMPIPGLKPKDLVGIPWRVAFALQADGWWLRSDIIWHKPNPMPESVRDRPTKAHEYIFLLTKKARYYYDADAIREADAGADHPRSVLHEPEPSGGLLPKHSGIRLAEGRNGAGRNKRTVWTVTTKPYKEAHFATFPPDLIEPCVLAGTSEKGCCSECGAGLVRETARAEAPTVDNSQLDRYGDGSAGVHRKVGQVYQNWLNENPKQTIGWRPACDCDAGTEPCTVLDPFSGAGTTGIVALRHGRHFIGIELSPEYADLSRVRIVEEGDKMDVEIDIGKLFDSEDDR